MPVEDIYMYHSLKPLSKSNMALKLMVSKLGMPFSRGLFFGAILVSGRVGVHDHLPMIHDMFDIDIVEVL